MNFFSLEYIQRRSIPEPNSGCWIWLGQLDKDGYGKFRCSVGDKWHKAHQVSLRTKGKTPSDFVTMHSCNVRCCVNPEHLSAGTQADNNTYMHNQGRGFMPPPGRPLKDICNRGHVKIGDNLMLSSVGKRYCRECNRQRSIQYRRKSLALDRP